MSAGELTVTAPYDGSRIAAVPRSDAAAIEKALSTAHGLYRDRDSWIAKVERIAILRRAMTIMKERAEELALQAAREGGKPLVDSQVEIDRAIDGIEVCIETMRTETGSLIPMNINPASAGHVAFTQHEPIGVVVAVSAFNHPFNLIVHQVAPAVAAGCPVIVKPASATPLSCFAFVDILHEAGLPKEWAQVIVPENNDLSTKMVTDPRVGFFSFIGSGKVGWSLRSQLAPGTRCALEHGGAAPVIIAKDADLEANLPRLAKGGFYHAGQVCVSVQRVFAHADIAQQVATGLAALGDKMKVGDPTDPDTEVGPIINHGECNRIDDWVQAAVAGGAKLVTGGKKLSDSCYAPTVLLDPPEDANVSKLEIFGPVICVYSYTDMDAAIDRANSLPVSFQAAVFTRDIDTAMRVYKRIDGTAIMVNDHTAFRVDWMPFAGARESGHGVGGIPYTIHEMQIEKMMVLRSDEI
ncbi:MAG TPA: aldehyde dehydrogenase [Alphaproteobacteria bacterium]|jgi:acyl-CoA reductase-like NAD-dependent aldehyde dehydrogenase|nr:aldehyde dehydrogenase [Alphaproteobacteria bacterium]HAM47185.1 aldehyde dehydrogenase [Alphaproteobacteria bacterium]HBA44067.1 aldehyde dehydrogenase [Alphaproteobacteria bacterium]HBF96999.1 aldehyde dehydrogenase [Alphaproteobacteria bacterium]